MNKMEILWKLAIPKFAFKSRNKILNKFQIQKLKKVESELLYCGIKISGLPEAGRAIAVTLLKVIKKISDPSNWSLNRGQKIL